MPRPGSWFLNAVLHKKETRDPWILSLWQRRHMMNLDILLSHKARRYSNTNGDMSERHRSYLEGTPIGHTWDNLSIKKNNGLIN